MYVHQDPLIEYDLATQARSSALYKINCAAHPTPLSLFFSRALRSRASLGQPVALRWSGSISPSFLIPVAQLGVLAQYRPNASAHTRTYFGQQPHALGHSEPTHLVADRTPVAAPVQRQGLGAAAARLLVSTPRLGLPCL
jgi:hypothetical protein